MDTALLTSIIALVVGLGGVITALATRRKTAAEASEVITDSAMKLLDPLNKRIDDLERRDRERDKRIAELERGIKILCAQIRKLGLKPDWDMDDILPVRRPSS
jgi:hypothetical protein